MVEFRSKIDDVMVGIYLNGDKGNIVYALGMPQYLDKYHPLVIQANRLGYNLFVPRYMGTYESDGQFSSKRSTETIETAVKLVKQGKTKELFAGKEISWAANPVYVLGFSYGALPSLLQREAVDKTAVVCPFSSMEFHGKDGLGEDVSETYEFLERAYPNLYRIRAQDVIADLENTQLPETKANLTIVQGLTDRSIPEAEIKMLQQKYDATLLTKEGGHSISMTDELFLKLF